MDDARLTRYAVDPTLFAAMQTRGALKRAPKALRGDVIEIWAGPSDVVVFVPVYAVAVGGIVRQP